MKNERWGKSLEDREGRKKSMDWVNLPLREEKHPPVFWEGKKEGKDRQKYRWALGDGGVEGGRVIFLTHWLGDGCHLSVLKFLLTFLLKSSSRLLFTGFTSPPAQMSNGLCHSSFTVWICLIWVFRSKVHTLPRVFILLFSFGETITWFTNCGIWRVFLNLYFLIEV